MNAQHHESLEKWKSKLQWDIISHQSEWPWSKNLQTINAGEGVEKREPSCPVVGNVNWCSHYGEQYGVSKKLKIDLPYDPAIPLLDIYPEKTIIQKESCTTMFIAAPFTIARTWKQPKCPSTDEWIKKMWPICTMEYYSTIKKEWNWVICSEVHGPRVCYTEWSKSGREKQIPYANTYIWNLKKKKKVVMKNLGARWE